MASKALLGYSYLQILRENWIFPPHHLLPRTHLVLFNLFYQSTNFFLLYVFFSRERHLSQSQKTMRKEYLVWYLELVVESWNIYWNLTQVWMNTPDDPYTLLTLGNLIQYWTLPFILAYNGADYESLMSQTEVKIQKPDTWQNSMVAWLLQ